MVAVVGSRVDTTIMYIYVLLGCLFISYFVLTYSYALLIKTLCECAMWSCNEQSVLCSIFCLCLMLVFWYGWMTGQGSWLYTLYVYYNQTTTQQAPYKHIQSDALCVESCGGAQSILYTASTIRKHCNTVFLFLNPFEMFILSFVWRYHFFIIMWTYTLK